MRIDLNPANFKPEQCDGCGKSFPVDQLCGAGDTQVMCLPCATCKLMTHSALDSFEVQELKRVWWSLRNITRTFDWLETEPIMRDIETMVSALKDAHLV
jgi:hypothetical protein